MKATEMIKGADDARRLLRGFKALDELAVLLDSAGAAVQAKEEADIALAGLREQIAARHVELEQAGVAVLTAKEDAKGIVANAKAAASDILTNAERAALAKMDDAAAGAIARLAGYNAEIAKALATLDGLKDDDARLRAQIADNTAKLDSVRAQAAALFGA